MKFIIIWMVLLITFLFFLFSHLLLGYLKRNQE